MCMCNVFVCVCALYAASYQHVISTREYDKEEEVEEEEEEEEIVPVGEYRSDLPEFSAAEVSTHCALPSEGGTGVWVSYGRGLYFDIHNCVCVCVCVYVCV
jgi:hypothetical protein